MENRCKNSSDHEQIENAVNGFSIEEPKCQSHNVTNTFNKYLSANANNNLTFKEIWIKEIGSIINGLTPPPPKKKGFPLV